MYLRVSAKNTDKTDYFTIESDGKKRPIDGFSRTASFECGENVNCHANIEYLPKNTTLRFTGWVIFILKEIITSVLFFLVFDKGAWYENICPFKIKKKVAFKPNSNEMGEIDFEFKNSRFNKTNNRYTLSSIDITANGIILTEEVGYLPNPGGIRLGFIHYIFQIAVPSLILLALCAYGIVFSIVYNNIPLLAALSVCSLIILCVDAVMLIRGIKTRRSVEKIVFSQMRSIKNNS